MSVYEQERRKPVFMFTVAQDGKTPPATFTFKYSLAVTGRLNGITRHETDQRPELLGSAYPIVPLEVGKSALLAINYPDNSEGVIETAPMTHIGPVSPDIVLPIWLR